MIDRYDSYDRTVTFAGLTWRVKHSDRFRGPGPNLFSDSADNVWVDEQGHLHLRITKRRGWWYAAEVIAEPGFGYGSYTFWLAGGADRLDDNSVLGLFTWYDDQAQGFPGEIDIEFSRWGDPEEPNTHFAVWGCPDCPKGHSFESALDGDASNHSFVWSEDGIDFQSARGQFREEGVYAQWRYDGEGIPRPGGERVRINLWLHRGDPPSDGEEVEVVITAFEFLQMVAGRAGPPLADGGRAAAGGDVPGGPEGGAVAHP